MRHYYIIGAYKHHFDPFWAVEPSVLLKSIGSSTQFDLGVKGMYDDRMWLGAGYRTGSGDITCLLGYTISESMYLGILMIFQLIRCRLPLLVHEFMLR